MEAAPLRHLPQRLCAQQSPLRRAQFAHSSLLNRQLRPRRNQSQFKKHPLLLNQPLLRLSQPLPLLSQNQRL